jgi:hypothetical protein
MPKQIFKYKWSINKYRKDKRSGPLDPEPRSDYLKMLFKEEEERFKNKK